MSGIPEPSRDIHTTDTPRLRRFVICEPGERSIGMHVDVTPLVALSKKMSAFIYSFDQGQGPHEPILLTDLSLPMFFRVLWYAEKTMSLAKNMAGEAHRFGHGASVFKEFSHGTKPVQAVRNAVELLHWATKHDVYPLRSHAIYELVQLERRLTDADQAALETALFNVSYSGSGLQETFQIIDLLAIQDSFALPLLRQIARRKLQTMLAIADTRDVLHIAEYVYGVDQKYQPRCGRGHILRVALSLQVKRHLRSNRPAFWSLFDQSDALAWDITPPPAASYYQGYAIDGSMIVLDDGVIKHL